MVATIDTAAGLTQYAIEYDIEGVAVIDQTRQVSVHQVLGQPRGEIGIIEGSSAVGRGAEVTRQISDRPAAIAESWKTFYISHHGSPRDE